MPVLGNITNKVKPRLGKGTYSATISGFSDVKDMKFGPTLQMYLDVDKSMEPDGWEDFDEPVELSDWISLQDVLGPKSKGYRVATAALKRDLEEGEPIDTDILVGKRVIITVDEKVDGDKVYARIVSYSPWGKKKAELVTAGAAPAKKNTPREAPDLD